MSTTPTPRLSIVVPAYNEAVGLPTAVEHLVASAGATRLTFELIIVDDDSADRTCRVLDALAAKHPEIRANRFH